MTLIQSNFTVSYGLKKRIKKKNSSDLLGYILQEFQYKRESPTDVTQDKGNYYLKRVSWAQEFRPIFS